MARGVKANPLLLELVESERQRGWVYCDFPWRALPAEHMRNFGGSSLYRLQPTPVLLPPQESDGRIPGTVVLSSQPVTLYP
jgi:hypothetical protein